jgi:diguanylate cyclase (GGDEF)-like protein
MESSSLSLPDEESLSFTVSFGVAEVDEKIDNLDDLMIQADAALYLAKASGRNQTCVADEVDASCYPD